MPVDVTTTLRKVLKQLQTEQARIEQQIATIQAVLTGRPAGRRPATRPTAPPKPPRKHRKQRMSAAARKAVSQRMKAYWAKRKAGGGAPKKTS